MEQQDRKCMDFEEMMQRAVNAEVKAGRRSMVADTLILPLFDLKTLLLPHLVTNHLPYYNLISSCKLIDNNLF